MIESFYVNNNKGLYVENPCLIIYLDFFKLLFINNYNSLSVIL